MIELDGIKFIISPNKNKKYRAIFNDGTHSDFGAKNYQHYFDKIGLYSSFNHLDNNRRANYVARHSAIKKKDGSLAISDIKSPAYLSLRYLW
jgi:hypothetical protein